MENKKTRIVSYGLPFVGKKVIGNILGSKEWSGGKETSNIPRNLWQLWLVWYTENKLKRPSRENLIRMTNMVEEITMISDIATMMLEFNRGSISKK